MSSYRLDKVELPVYNRKCPSAVTEEDIQAMKGQINSMFNDADRVSTMIAYESDELIVSMSYFDNVWSFCTRDMLMIDFDYKEGFTYQTAIDTIKDYTEFMHNKGVDLKFRIYITDRGVHAFLTSHRIDVLSDNAMKMVVDLCNDPYYIAFSTIRGFCVRIGPKIKQKLEGRSLQEVVDTEFIAKVDTRNVSIGYGKEDPYILKILSLHERLIKWFVKQYRDRLNELSQLRYIVELDKFDMTPPVYFKDEVAQEVIKLLTEMGIETHEGKYPITYRYINKPMLEHVISVYYSSDIRLLYDLYYGIWAICTPDILMIDFDYNDEMDAVRAIQKLSNFALTEYRQGRKYLFTLYKTDNGLHAFISNKRINRWTEEGEYILRTLSNDLDFINFTYYGGHCVRVGPKILKKGKLITRDDSVNQFITERCVNNFCNLGYGQVSPDIEAILTIHELMVDYLKKMYDENFEEMTTFRYVKQVNSKVYSPSDEIVGKVKKHFRVLINRYFTDVKEATYLERNTKVSSNRYKDLLDDKALEKCAKNSIESLNWTVKEVIIPFQKQTCDKDTVLLRGPNFPFVFGQDGKSHIVFIALYDIMMLDWDVKDGVPKDSVVEMIERFINSQKVKTENTRVALSTPCFKIYETDGGIHAWLISDFAPYHSDVSSNMMMETCSDFYYAAFSKVRGYNVRLSPKLIDKKTNTFFDQDYIKSQYIQKLGYKGTVYVGDKKNINPYIEEFVDVIYDFQRKLLKMKDYDILLMNRDKTFLTKIQRTMSNLYMGMDNRSELENSKRWAIDAMTCKGLLY